MADQVIEILIKAVDEFTSTMNGITKSVINSKKTLLGLGVVAGGVFAGATAVMMSSINAASKYEAVQMRLSTIVGNVAKQHGATNEEIKSQIDLLNKQALALEQIGVADKDNIAVVQSQLATFDMSTEAIHNLTPALLDYIVAEKGASASAEDFRQMTNGLAQALNGNFASLTRTGFILDDTTKELIKNGTEAEKTAAIVKVLNSTYKGMNEAATGTAEGGMILLWRSINDIQEAIGGALLPILQQFLDFVTPIIKKVSEWVEQHPKLTAAILLLTIGLSGLVVGIVALIFAWTALMFVSWPVVGVVLAIAAAIVGLVAVGYIIYNQWSNIVNFIKETFAPELAVLNEMARLVGKGFQWMWDVAMKPVWDSLVEFYNWIKDKFLDVLEKASSIMGKIKGGVNTAREAVSNAITSQTRKVNDFVVTKNGQVLETSPDDTIFGMKNTSSFGKGITIIIEGNNIYGTDPDAIASALNDKLQQMISI